MRPRETSRPRVFSCTPTRGTGHWLAAQSHFALPTRGEVEIIPGMVITSALAHGFNMLWAGALNFARAGALDYFLLHHDDIEIQTHGWLDVMVAEMKRTGAAALSVVQAIKSDLMETSTAVDLGSPWAPRKLTLAEIGELPETFCQADTPWPDRTLVINTGLLLLDLSRPEWREKDSQTGELLFRFHMIDRLVEKPDGDVVAQFRPEDWEMSRWMAAKGMPYYATRKVVCMHHGDKAFTNQPPSKVA